MRYRRHSVDLLLSAGLTLAGVLAAFLASSVLILLVGQNPVEAFRALFVGAFGSANSWAETVVKTSPLLLVGVGVCVAFRAKVWNIGAEGQLYMGALAATAFLLYVPLPASPFLMLPLAVLAGFLGGALFSLIPALLRAYGNINEIIVTILLNYVAIYASSYFIYGPMRTTEGPLPVTDIIPAAGNMPILVAGTRLHAGILIGIAVAVLAHTLLWRTSYGYELRIVGANRDAAAFAGLPVARSIVLAMVISGGIAGMAGMVEISALHHRLLDNISPGYGFTGIVVALLAKLNPLAAILSALLFGGLIVGGDSMQRASGTSVMIVYIIQGLVVLMVLGMDYVAHHLKRARGAPVAEAA